MGTRGDDFDDIIDDSFDETFSASFTQIRERHSDIISSSSSSSESSPIAVKRNIKPVINSSDEEDNVEDNEENSKSPSSVSNAGSSKEQSIVLDNNNKENLSDDNVIELSSDGSDDEKDDNTNQNLPKNHVNKRQYQEQVDLVRILNQDILQIENTLRVVNLKNLPDQGRSVLEKHKQLKARLQQAQSVLDSMVITEPPQVPTTIPNFVQLSWDEINSGVNTVQPKTFGKKGIATFQEQKALTTDLLENIHTSQQSCPKENEFVNDPMNLRVELMHHQKQALAWLLWRENSKPSGGILADDMGLGKTLTMIALTMKSLELKDDNDSDDSDDEDSDRKTKYTGGTLVVCPASVVNQWEDEINKRTARGALSINLYHGPKREDKAKSLARYDVVLTTYTIVKNECQKNGIISRIKWRRIILDEAHQIRNYKSQTSEAVCQLRGKSKWALTGTPVHNKELDVYSLLKFIKCTPFDNLAVWKRWVADKSTGGQERLNAVISSMMLRRTKAELIEKGTLQSMPERKWELICVALQENEKEIYQKILLFSRTLFAQFLHQRAEKNSELLLSNRNLLQPQKPNDEYVQMREKLLKFHKRKEIKQHEILVLLLRLRQVCCHPFLISQMLDGEEDLGEADSSEETEELNLLEQLNKLDLNEHDTDVRENNPPGDSVTLKEASKGFFKASNPVFSRESQSSKFKVLLDLLKEKLTTGDKAIIVSSWSKLLSLIGDHLERMKMNFVQLDGKIPVNKRQPLIDNFNNPKHPVKIMLLSLTAGGVGLNLTGGNHLFLMDLHWNPQMERQAQDRIYRVGQKKPVFIYKIMVEHSIEERIKALQDHKLEIADKITQGSKDGVTNKLSLQDLKMLFEM